MNADGSGQLQLTDNNVPDLTPTWSLDGNQIVFVRTVSGRQQLFRMNADGTEVTQITDTVGVNTAASQGVVKVAGLKGGAASARTTAVFPLPEAPATTRMAGVEKSLDTFPGITRISIVDSR
jgi:hypothetical protein